MDSQLKFDADVNNIVMRVHNIANLIHKCFFVWSPQSVGLIKKIESVQRQFTKRFPYCRYLTYNGIACH